MDAGSRWLAPGALALTVAVMVSVVVVRPGAAPGQVIGAGLASYSEQGLAFEYPAAWKANEIDLGMHYQTVLAYIASASASGTMTCGTDYIPGAGGTCDQHLTFGPDSVVIKVSEWDGPPTLTGSWPGP